ncbi:Nuclease [Paracoccus nototheniae]|uniref:hypothetical protein n=1 Tax=Paracoccus nototheniae TaxID=2489002 RepID=UPI00103DE338|nr:hypothetical protein [Paracoccus nototheniae]
MFRPLCLAIALLTAPAAPALAQDAEPTFCTARINNRDVVMGFDKAEARLSENYSRREQLAARVGRGEACPSYVVLRSLTPELNDEERGPFCLRHDEDSESVIGYDLGPRDAYGRCEQPSGVCQRVNRTRDASVAIAGAAARRSFQGVETVAGSKSGAVILSGSAATISSALGSIGGAAAAVASAPAVIAGAAVSVVAVGGAVYACGGG